MTRIAIELDMSANLIEAAIELGLLSSSALSKLIRRELEKRMPPQPEEFNPADYLPGYQPWMMKIVSPDLFGSVSQNCTDEELMELIEADWNGIRGSWGSVLEDDHDCD